jgi:hypothetical protein
VAIATHGRGIFVIGVATLRQMTAAALAAGAKVFAPRAVVLERRVSTMADGFSGHASWRTPNPPPAVELDYHLAGAVDEPAVLEILDARGRVVRKLAGAKSAGVHRLAWDLRGERAAATAQRGPATRPGSRDDAGQDRRPGPRGRRAAGALVPPGTYRVRLTAGGRTSTASFEVKPDPRGE